MNWLAAIWSGKPTKSDIEYFERMRREEAEKAAAVEHINALMRMDDTDFVAAVRRIEEEGPSWLNLTKWHEFTRRELDFRLLLKGNQKCT